MSAPSAAPAPSASPAYFLAPQGPDGWRAVACQHTYYFYREGRETQWHPPPVWDEAVEVCELLTGAPQLADSSFLAAGQSRTLNLSDEFAVHIHRRLSRGATSSVYHGIHRATKAAVAVKKMRDAKQAEREFKLLRMFDHKNIIRGAGLCGPCYGHSWIVMPLAAGGDLVSLLELHSLNRNRLTQYDEQVGDMHKVDVNRMCADIRDGVAELHRREVLHRDVKPGNCLATSTDLRLAVIMLTDFDISIRVKDLGMSRKYTPLYGAPEVEAGLRYGMEADLYSVGALFFFMMHGYGPFDGFKYCQLLLQKNGRKFTVRVGDDRAVCINRLMDPEPKSRMTLEQLNASEWMQTCTAIKERREAVGDEEDDTHTQPDADTYTHEEETHTQEADTCTHGVDTYTLTEDDAHTHADPAEKEGEEEEEEEEEEHPRADPAEEEKEVEVVAHRQTAQEEEEEEEGRTGVCTPCASYSPYVHQRPLGSEGIMCAAIDPGAQQLLIGRQRGIELFQCISFRPQAHAWIGGVSLIAVVNREVWGSGYLLAGGGRDPCLPLGVVALFEVGRVEWTYAFVVMQYTGRWLRLRDVQHSCVHRERTLALSGAGRWAAVLTQSGVVYLSRASKGAPPRCLAQLGIAPKPGSTVLALAEMSSETGSKALVAWENAEGAAVAVVGRDGAAVEHRMRSFRNLVYYQDMPVRAAVCSADGRVAFVTLRGSELLSLSVHGGDGEVLQRTLLGGLRPALVANVASGKDGMLACASAEGGSTIHLWHAGQWSKAESGGGVTLLGFVACGARTNLIAVDCDNGRFHRYPICDEGARTPLREPQHDFHVGRVPPGSAGSRTPAVLPSERWLFDPSSADLVERVSWVQGEVSVPCKVEVRTRRIVLSPLDPGRLTLAIPMRCVDEAARQSFRSSAVGGKVDVPFHPDPHAPFTDTLRLNFGVETVALRFRQALCRADYSAEPLRQTLLLCFGDHVGRLGGLGAARVDTDQAGHPDTVLQLITSFVPRTDCGTPMLRPQRDLGRTCRVM